MRARAGKLIDGWNVSVLQIRPDNPNNPFNEELKYIHKTQIERVFRHARREREAEKKVHIAIIADADGFAFIDSSRFEINKNMMMAHGTPRSSIENSDLCSVLLRTAIATYVIFRLPNGERQKKCPVTTVLKASPIA